MSILTPMRYKDYVWPHNPRTYSIRYHRVVSSDKIPFAHYHMQDLGLSYRVLSGEGEFSGEGAYDEFKRLASVFYHSGAGTLIHPIWQPSSAYFVALELTQEPRQDYVSYRFEFWEDTALHTPGVYESPTEQNYVVTQPSSYSGSAGSSGSSSSSSSSSSSKPSSSSSASASSTKQSKPHLVKTGETLASVARSSGLTVSRLLELNPSLRPGSDLRSGDVLQLA